MTGIELGGARASGRTYRMMQAVLKRVGEPGSIVVLSATHAHARILRNTFANLLLQEHEEFRTTTNRVIVKGTIVHFDVCKDFLQAATLAPCTTIPNRATFYDHYTWESLFHEQCLKLERKQKEMYEGDGTTS